MSLFSAVEMAPRDPILGLNEQFAADTNPNKVNLGVGVYFDENGKLPLLACVQAAEKALMDAPKPRGYLPIDGIAAYDNAVKKLVFGAAGFELLDYTYFDPATHGLDFDGMLADLRKLEPGTTVLLHACCHNPTGADLTVAQWTQVAALLKERKLFPFVDMAYQGFSKGLREDAVAIGALVDAGIDTFIVTSSYSKSFSLYGERVGALSVVAATAAEAKAVQSHAKRIIRTIYSSRPRTARRWWPAC